MHLYISLQLGAYSTAYCDDKTISAFFFVWISVHVLHAEVLNNNNKDGVCLHFKMPANTDIRTNFLQANTYYSIK